MKGNPYLNTPVRTVYKDDVIAGENLREEQKILEPPNFSVALTFCSMYVALFINTLWQWLIITYAGWKTW